LTTLPLHVHAGLTYRADIDGMRALAVIAVVLYHGWPTWFQGGFVGVDIFFVISGYLITSIILAQLQAGTFTIGGFYLRRIRRIFPALILVLLATLAFGWAVLLHAEWRQLGTHALAGAGFVSNFVLWHEAGYFDNAGITKPLLHLWSLGVEEQYYIAWPLILRAASALRWRFAWIAAALFTASLAACLLMADTDPVAAFFSPFTRFWELSAGGIAAWLHLHHNAGAQRHASLLAWSGALLLLLSFTLITPQSPYPGWRAALPVGGALLLILAGPWTAVNRLLALRPFAATGLISYPLYLWHWPLLSFAHIVRGQKPPAQVKLTLIALACVLAVLTWRLFERPLRAHADRLRVGWTLGAGMSAVALAGLTIGSGRLAERIDSRSAAPYLAALNDSEFPGPALRPLRYDGIVFQKVSSRTSGLTVFIGDSVMQQYAPRIAHALAAEPARFNSVIFAAAGGCAPIENTVRLPQMRFPLCARSTAAAYALAASAQVDTVVVGAAWNGYFSDSQREMLFNDGKVRKAFPDPEAQELAWNALRKSLVRLRAAGKRVFVILQPPAGAAFDPQTMYRGTRLGTIEAVAKIAPFDLADYELKNAAPRARLAAIAAATGAIVIDPAQHLCSGGSCPVLDDAGAPLYTDGIHMRPAYSRRAANFLDQTLEK